MIARFPACRLPPQAEEAPEDFFFSFTGRELTFLCVQPAVQLRVWWCALLCCSCAVVFWAFALSRLGFGGLLLAAKMTWIIGRGISFCSHYKTMNDADIRPVVMR